MLANAAKTVTGWTVEERLTPEVRMFQSTFLFHGYIIPVTELLFIKNNFKAGLPKFRAIEYILAACTIGTCEELQKFGEHDHKRGPVLCLRAILAKAKFCEHFFLEWDHSILLKLFPETFIGFMLVHISPMLPSFSIRELSKFQRGFEHVSNCKNFESKSRRALI